MSEGHGTGEDFDEFSWHDCHIWGLDIVAGAPHENDWTSDLALDIDLIVGGREVDDDVEFDVVPASLVFHGVTAFGMAVDPGESEAWTAIHPWSIDHIERTRVEDQRVFLDRPYYRWRILLNWPSDSEIGFGAHGFTQTARGRPVTVRGGRQSLTLRERAPVEDGVPFHAVATLTVLAEEADAFEAFERGAAAVMAEHGGAFERVVRTGVDRGVFREVHVLRFPDRAAFAAYRADPRLTHLLPLREASIVRTELLHGGEGPGYANHEG